MSASLLIEVSISPISEREMPQLEALLRRQGVRPLWQHRIERQGVYFFEFRAEIALGHPESMAFFDQFATSIWRTIRRYVRLVIMTPEIEAWPGGKEFSEHDYRRLMRQQN